MDAREVPIDKEYLAILHLIYQEEGQSHEWIQHRMKEDPELEHILRDARYTQKTLGFSTLQEHLDWLKESYQEFQPVIESAEYLTPSSPFSSSRYSLWLGLGLAAGIALLILFVLRQQSISPIDMYDTYIVQTDRHPFLNTQGLVRSHLPSPSDDTLDFSSHIQSLFSQGAYQEVLNQIEQWEQEVKGDSVSYLYHKAFVYKELEDWPHCIESLEALTEIQGHFYQQQAHLMLALMYRELGKEDQGQLVLQQLLKKSFLHPAVRKDAQALLDVW